MPTHILPLFPLELVLFPASSFPLHIFEERYTIMIEECLTNDTMFGINSINANGSMSSIGCTARITDVLKKNTDNTLDIIVEGVGRYMINQVYSHLPYYTADISYIHDKKARIIPLSQRQECIDIYNKIIEVVFNNDPDLIISGIDEESAVLSFIIAQKAGLSLSQKQQLLEMTQEDERLLYLLRHLSLLLPSIVKAESISTIVACDGYFSV